MNAEEKAYIDKKFSELEQKLINPNPEEAWQRAKKYQRYYMGKYMKISIAGGIIVLAAMLYAYHLMGLF